MSDVAHSVTALRRAGEIACAQGTPAVMLGSASRAESRSGADVTGVELVR